MPDDVAFETALATAIGVIHTLERPGIEQQEMLARVTYAILDAIHSVGQAEGPATLLGRLGAAWAIVCRG